MSSCHCTCKVNFLYSGIPHFVFQPNSSKDLEVTHFNFFPGTPVSVVSSHLFPLSFFLMLLLFFSKLFTVPLTSLYRRYLLASIIPFASIHSPELVADSTLCIAQCRKMTSGVTRQPIYCPNLSVTLSLYFMFIQRR